MNQTNPKDIWRTALGELQLQVTKPYYDTYLKSTEGLQFEDGRFTIGVPSPFGVEWLYLRMCSRIEEVLSSLMKGPVTARFAVRQDSQAIAIAPAVSSGFAGGASGSHDSPSFTSHPEPTVPPARSCRASPFNNRYTFDTMVIGSFNRMAHAAATTAASDRAPCYNPLFIYSGFGQGKTHLLHAIDHAALSNTKTVLYVSAEQFTNDLVTASRERSYHRIREKYRQVDLLLIDDVQFIGGKQQTQEFLYHTFNWLHNAGKQIVIASDCHPGDIPEVVNRLVSRFEGGLLVDITPPGLEARTAILESKASQRGIRVPRPVLESVARQVTGSVRRLEGALNRVVAFARASDAELTTDLAAEALAVISRDPRDNPSSDSVINNTAAHFDLRPDDLRGRGRRKELVVARDVTMYLLREELKLQPMRIGSLLGDRTPAGVTMSCRKIARKLPRDEKLRSDISLIRDTLYSHKSPYCRMPPDASGPATPLA